MNPIVVFLAFECMQPTLIDKTGLGWRDPMAVAAVERATKTCRTVYSGCLHTMTRMTREGFQAICEKPPSDKPSSGYEQTPGGE